MTLTIDLSDEEKAALTAKARTLGLSAEHCIRQVLEHDLAPEWLPKPWQNNQTHQLDYFSSEERDAEIFAAQRKARVLVPNRDQDPRRFKTRHHD